jgi:hypothetical protein
MKKKLLPWKLRSETTASSLLFARQAASYTLNSTSEALPGSQALVMVGSTNEGWVEWRR